MNTILTSTTIRSKVSGVWPWLTEPPLMKIWMGEPAMNLEIITNWTIGSPILIKGFHHAKFENKGKILKYEPDCIIQYTHLSSISRLQDVPENYSTITFTLDPEKDCTVLTIEVKNFPNESIFKHLNLYWMSAPAIIKKLIEGC